MLTRKDNVWNNKQIARYIEVLDQIEETEGPGVLVTIGTGKRHFSTGFDLPFWAEKYENFTSSIYGMQEILARLLEFPMPTMCVFNGNAIAGGYILGLVHDFRIMHESNGIICLSELKLGMSLPPAYMKVCAAKMSARVCNKLVYGITVQ